jgi:SPP1 family predicted phage head-tail adaptor
MSQISAGTLSCRVTIQESHWQKDELGAPRQAWVDRATVWASIEPINARDAVIANRLSTEVTHLITIRFHKLLADPMTVSALRLVYGNRTFRITGIVNEGNRNVAIAIHATEVSSDEQQRSD